MGLRCFPELCKRVSLSHRQQQEDLLPVLQRQLASVTQSLAACLEVKDMAHAWYV